MPKLYYKFPISLQQILKYQKTTLKIFSRPSFSLLILHSSRVPFDLRLLYAWSILSSLYPLNTA